MRAASRGAVVALAALAAFPAAGIGAPRSAVHPAPTTPPAVPARRSFPPVFFEPGGAAWPPFSLVSGNETATLYSRAVNVFTAHAAYGDTVWLGTEGGVKRIDRKRGVVRHYTLLEGLPGDRIVALAAEGDDSVWCMVALARGNRAFRAFCRWDPRRDRWETLREIPARTIDSPLESPAIAVGPDVVCFSPGSATPKAGAALYLFDKRERRFQDVAYRDEETVVSVRLVHGAGDDLWLGTNLGVLRYARRSGNWRRYLPDHQFFAGAAGRDGAFWLAGRDPGGGWRLTRFDPAAEKAREFVPPPSPGLGPAAVTAEDADAGIWVTLPSARGFDAPVFYRFDPPTEQWQQQKSAPDAVLLAPALLRATQPLRLRFLPAFSGELARRFPGWFCPAEDLPDAVRNPPDRSVPDWDISGDALLRRENGNVERFPLPEVPVALTPPLNALARMGDTLYVALYEGMRALDLRTETWRNAQLPPLGAPSEPRLIAAGGRLWAETAGGDVLRADPATGEFAVALAAVPGESRRLIGVAGDGALWLAGGDGGLYRAGPKAERAEPVALPPLPPGTETAGGQAAVLSRQPAGFTDDAVSGPRIWYVVSDAVLIGYETKTGTWTPALPWKRSASSFFPLADADGVTVATADSEAAVRRYDAAARRWEAVVPPLPRTMTYHPTVLVSLDARDVWLLNTGRIALCRWDRARATWTVYPCPGEMPAVSATGLRDVAARHGDAIFVATKQGLWRFDIPAKAWRQLPIPTRGGFALEQIFDGGSAIWALCRHRQSGQIVAARFEKQARTWTVWDASSGFPERENPRRLVPDGEAAWVLTNTGARRLDPKTNRWIDLAPALSGDAGTPVRVADIVPDGAHVWLAADPGPLARYDRATGIFQRLFPPEERAASGGSLRVEAGAVWLATTRGAYRFDKASGVWEKIAAEAGSALAAFPAERILRTGDGALWFVSRQSALRWTGKR